MQLDFPTLFIIILLNAFSLAVVWLLVVLKYRELISARYWLGGVVLNCVSGPMLFLGYGVSGLNYIGLTLVTLSFAMVWQGAAAFYDLPPRTARVGILTAGTMAAFLLFGTSQITINVIAAATQIGAVGLAAGILLRAVDKYIGSYVAILAAALLIAGQGAEAVTNIARLMGLMTTEAYYKVGAWFLVCAIIGGVLLNLGFVLMTMNRAQDALLRLAEQDELTGLPNRRGLHTRVAALSPFAKAGETTLAVLALDLDRFKSINDQFGHDAGDAALVHVTQNIMQSLRKNDIMARLGGDEFCIVLHGVDHAEAMAFANRVVKLIASTPLTWGGHTLNLSISVGVSEWDPHEQPEIASALKSADGALIGTKASKRTHNPTAVHLPGPVPPFLA
ncbi:GGDEF domain-containing protein [Falsirhodobacter deserti]|uniref:GGDEF domain-containing protein n=1 Tax=Falsirhodobacter deserti TaxID=1365611 RepID=UPI000FE43660|nr:GGDEF domain-containing protein [Falsirhodobacter deserti]